MPQKYSAVVRRRAVRMVIEYLLDYPSRLAAFDDLGAKFSIGPATLQIRVAQAQIGVGV